MYGIRMRKRGEFSTVLPFISDDWDELVETGREFLPDDEDEIEWWIIPL